MLGVGTGSRLRCWGLGASLSAGGKIGVPDTDLMVCPLLKLDVGVVKEPDFRGTNVGVGIGVADILCFVGESPDICWINGRDAENEALLEGKCWLGVACAEVPLT